MRLAGLAIRASAVFALTSTLHAHDFWIEPSSFRPAVGSVVSARLMVGEGFRGEPVPRNPALIEKFVLASGQGETPVAGRAAEDPAGRVSILAPGLLVMGYRSLNSSVSLEAAQFEEYLREEGLETIIQARTRGGESQKPAREVFSRCAKALLAAGGGAKTGYDRILGLTLELVPEKNPYALKAGQELPVRVLYQGKPLAGTLVAALAAQRPEKKLSRRTDRDGRVRLPLPDDGVWLVKAVHMVPAATGTGADWQSLWASLTFEMPPASPVGRVP